MLSPYILKIRQQLQVVPRPIITMLAKYLPILKEMDTTLRFLESINDEQLAQIDADFESLLDGIADKNEEIVADIVQRWNVSGDGVIAAVIMRLMGVKENA